MKKDNLIKDSTNSILFTHKIKEHEEKDDDMINQIIFKKYEVKKKCGRASTIDIYEGISKDDDQPVLIKIEKRTQKRLYLETEAYNLYSFKGFGIPELIKFGKKNNNIILIQSKLGPSLSELFTENNKQFSLNEICLIGIQCIERLKWIHSKNYIYRNIKPENFLIGVEDPHVIYLKNFYLCEKYKSSKTDKHVKFQYTKEIVGTQRYGSINALRGLRQGRKDDLESLCYMLIYFFLGKLPWQGIKADNEALKHEKLLNEKKNFNIENYKQIPKDFCTLFKYVKNLKFEEEPKYSIMIRLLQNIRNENQCFSNTNFFWVKKNAICLGTNIKTKKEGFRERLYAKIDKKVKTDNINEFEKKKIKNIDEVNFENIGKGYVDDDEDYVEENRYEKSAHQAKVNLFFSNNENNVENNEEDKNESRENELNLSNSSINTRVFKLNGEVEEIVRKDLMNDTNINNFDDWQNKIKNKPKTIQEQNKINSTKKSDKLNINCNEIIQEEPLNEEEEEEKYQENMDNKNVIQENIIKENNNNINIIDNKYKGKTFISSNSNGTIKQESTKESIQINYKDTDIKNNNNQGSIILVNNNKNEDEKNKNISKKREKKSVDKIKIQKRNENKFGQIMGPEVNLKRSKSIIKKSTKKDKNKDCIIF